MLACSAALPGVRSCLPGGVSQTHDGARTRTLLSWWWLQPLLPRRLDVVASSRARAHVFYAPRPRVSAQAPSADPPCARALARVPPPSHIHTPHTCTHTCTHTHTRAYLPSRPLSPSLSTPSHSSRAQSMACRGRTASTARPTTTCECTQYSTACVRGAKLLYAWRRPMTRLNDTDGECARVDRTKPAAVVFSFHGWGSSASFNEGYMGLTRTADDNGFFVVYPDGRSDYQRETNNGWGSFNAVGSTCHGHTPAPTVPRPRPLPPQPPTPRAPAAPCRALYSSPATRPVTAPPPATPSPTRPMFPANANARAPARGAGTTTLSGAPECTRNTYGYCYKSCESRSQGCGKCDWTTCADDDLFVSSILNEVEATYAPCPSLALHRRVLLAARLCRSSSSSSSSCPPVGRAACPRRAHVLTRPHPPARCAPAHARYCVDSNNVHATGYSNGGMMVYQLGMTLASRFASLVQHSAAQPTLLPPPRCVARVP